MHTRQILFGLALSTALSGCGNSSDTPAPSQSGFALNDQGYFEQQGVGLMVFQDTSPESRQSGLILVSHDNRLASNGDLRLELTPGQWSPVPRLLSRTVDRENGEIVATLKYPDER